MITLIACFVVIYTHAQNIENLKIDQNGGELAIHYDLNSPNVDVFKVSVFYSVNNKDWFAIEKVYGDVGDSILTGKTKNMVLWVDHLTHISDKVQFKLIAEYYTVEQSKEGDLKDKNGVIYTWKRIGKTKWMTQNLKSSTSDENCGGTFNNSSARNACPDEWHLPTDEEWMEFEVEFGVDKNKVKEHGLRQIDLSKLNDAGFAINECDYKTSLYPNQKALAFWTSSENKMLYTGYSDKYFARIIRIDDNKISKELRSKSEELSVRCVQSSVFLAKIEATTETGINLKPVTGVVNHPFTGEELDWIYVGKAIWMKKDITGSYMYKETADRCPTGWRLPEKEEWENLIKEFEPSIKLENEKQVLSERLSSDGIWGFSLSGNDYWLNTHHYTYNTYWISDKDKEDSKKVLQFVTNVKGEAGWKDKYTSETAKVRCVLDNEKFITEKDKIKNGSFVDSRDQKEYGFVEIENKVWMSENLNYDLGENSMCRNNIKTDCNLFGHLYNIEVISTGCPDGWRIPTLEEWKYLLINKAANNLKILYPFGGTGFDLLLGGEMIYDEESKSDVFSAKYLFNDGEKPGYYYIDSKGKVELSEKVRKKDFYYVRCIKEVDSRF